MSKVPDFGCPTAEALHLERYRQLLAIAALKVCIKRKGKR